MADSNATKNALAASMKKLMRKKPFEKISVSDICEDCGINRKSFYYHFRDKYDLVNWIFYVGFIGELDVNSYDSGWDMYSDMCKYFYREKEFYNAALKIEGQNSFKDYLIETVSPLAEFFLKDILPHNEDDSFVVAFVTDALLTSLVRWLSDGYGREIGADEYIAKIKDISMQIGSMAPVR
ncbi:MAG: TetR/AcrR family transcriptional regulator C-terminal domain-containing protein [Firmicutes bacterium]|nr:TetR/AcrR family transcriptional regulator C-terminal domain-containing protein [Bacillota bacterium]